MTKNHNVIAVSDNGPTTANSNPYKHKILIIINNKVVIAGFCHNNIANIKSIALNIGEKGNSWGFTWQQATDLVKKDIKCLKNLRIAKEGTKRLKYLPEFEQFAEAVSASHSLEAIFVGNGILDLKKLQNDTEISIKRDSFLSTESGTTTIVEDFAILTRCIAKNQNLQTISFEPLTLTSSNVESLIISNVINIINHRNNLKHIVLASTHFTIPHVMKLLKAIKKKKEQSDTAEAFKLDLHWEYTDFKDFDLQAKKSILWVSKKFGSEFDDGIYKSSKIEKCIIELDVRNCFRRSTHSEKAEFEEEVDTYIDEKGSETISNIKLIVEESIKCWDYRTKKR